MQFLEKLTQFLQGTDNKIPSSQKSQQENELTRIAECHDEVCIVQNFARDAKHKFRGGPAVLGISNNTLVGAPHINLDYC